VVGDLKDAVTAVGCALEVGARSGWSWMSGVLEAVGSSQTAAGCNAAVKFLQRCVLDGWASRVDRKRGKVWKPPGVQETPHRCLSDGHNVVW